MEPSKEAISVRASRLSSQICNRTPLQNGTRPFVTKEGLLDAFTVLYEECNNDSLKRADKYVAAFVDKFRTVLSELKRLRVNVSDFEVKKVIGRGHFGEVHVVREKQTGDVYAMKSIRKSDSLTQQSACYEEERDIMALGRSSWLTSLQYAFQDTSHLYLVMDFHPGGDLLGLLERQGGRLAETESVFYLSELVQAIHTLHCMGYVHRDVKPDNVLLDRCGHLKLADFGSAARLNIKGVVSDKDVISIGTPDYIAPEVLQSIEKGKVKKVTYGTGCDFWSLGILAFELTMGNTPFSGTTVTATYNKIMNHSVYLKFPATPGVSEDYANFIRALLCDQSLRLNHKEIINHVLFKEVDWTTLHEQVPPFVPKVNGVDDTSNFIEIQSKKGTPSVENFKSRNQFSGRNLPFIGFTFMPDVETEPAYVLRKSDDVLLENKKKQVESLQKKLARAEHSNKEYNVLENKYEQYGKRLQNLEDVRSKLEKDLASSITECSSLKRTLELERSERKELEERALELIKSSKVKWTVSTNERINKLNEMIENQTGKITNLCTTNNELISKLERAELHLEQANMELERLKKFECDHKDALAKARAQSRHSVAGIENQLERISAEARSQIADLQSKLMVTTESKRELENHVADCKKHELVLEEYCRISQEQCNNLKGELRASDSKCYELQMLTRNLQDDLKGMDKLQQELRDSNKEIIVLKNENKCEKLEEELKQERKQCILLKNQLKDLRNSLNESLSLQESTLQEKQAEHSSDIKQLKDQLKILSEEREILQCSLSEAQERDSMNRIKVEGLEQLLARLENGVSKLENGSDRESVLQEQVARLEGKLKELHETAALEKQELRTTNSNLWRKEKELSNCELDKRILQRELKSVEEKHKSVSDELKKSSDALEIQKDIHNEAFNELKRISESQSSNALQLKATIKELEEEIQNYTSKYENEHKSVSQLKMDLQNALGHVERLKNDFASEVKAKTHLEKQLHSIREDNIKLHCNRDMFRQSEETVKAELSKCKSELEKAELNLNVLRDACTLLENQLEEYEQLISVHLTKEKKLESQMAQLTDDLVKAKLETNEAKQAWNEEEYYKQQTQIKCVELEQDVELYRSECVSFKNKILQLKEKSENVSEELAACRDRCAELEHTCAAAQRQLNDFKTENITIKRESADRLTHIHQIRETNYKLNQEFLECKDDNSELIGKIASLEGTLNERNTYFNQREMKFNATIQQQTKLIDFLQSKVEEGKKKKTLTDKIFGSSRKENIAPTLVLNYKEMESLLFKERENSKKMQDEILKLKTDSLKLDETPSKLPVSPKTKMALEQLVRSPASQHSEFERKPSIQRMHHNIPHRFESRLCMKVSKCAACSQSLAIGRTLSVCKECSVTAHSRCALKVPRTCGLPGEYAKHFTNTLSSSSSEGKNEANDGTSDIQVQGWLKIPTREKSGWEKKFACIDSTVLKIYEHEPSLGLAPVDTLELCPADGRSSLMEDVSSKDCGNTASTDLPFIIKIDVSPETTCWPAKSQLLMLLSTKDKEKWIKALNKIFEKHYPDKPITGKLLMKCAKSFEFICVQELTKNVLILGCVKGLFVSVKGNTPVHIRGPTHVQQIHFIKQISCVLMIAGDKRSLVRANLKHLESLVNCTSHSEPNLEIVKLNINSHDGFHMFQACDFNRRQIVCTATSKQLFIIKYDYESNDFLPLRVLDTAEPCSCVLFNKHSVIVGANKFFEIDLENFQTDEFLDASDHGLILASNCYKMGSYPIAIMLVNQKPIEYLLCFNEFGIFVDEFGRRNRCGDIKWNHVPVACIFISPFLYMVQFSAVEIVRITPEHSDDVSLQSWLCPDSVRLEFDKPKFLGSNKNGIFLSVQNEIVFIDANTVTGNYSLSDMNNSSDDNERDFSDGGTEFSFNSSALEGLPSEDESVRLQFSTETDM